MGKNDIFTKYPELQTVSLKTDDGKRGIKSFVLRTNPLSERLTDGVLKYYDKYAYHFNEKSIRSKQKIDLHSLFINKDATLFVEIGFGNGESFVKMAENNKDKNFFGFDVYLNGFAECLTSIGEKSLTNAMVMRCDAKEFLMCSVHDESLDGVNIFFPDPWPKKKHHKRRLINNDFVELLALKLKKNGIIHFATDIEDYAEEALSIFKNNPSLTNMFQDYSPSPYGREHSPFEQKGLLGNRTISDIVFIKKWLCLIIKPMQDNTIVTVDFGSSNIRLCVGELTGGELRVIGVFERAMKGVKNGMIENFDEALKCVKALFNEVNFTLYFYPRQVHLGLDLGVFKQVDELNNIIKNISPVNINILLSSLTVKKEYALFQRYIDLFGTAGVKIVKFYPFPIVSIPVLTEYDDRMNGIVVIDIGENMTSVVSMLNNKITMIESVPYGGADITNDIAEILQKNRTFAKAIKEEYGSAYSINIDNTSSIALMQDNSNIAFSKKEFSKIIESRMNEIFTALKNAIYSVPRIGSYSQGVLLLGGSALLLGMTHLADAIFLLPSHIGFPEALNGLSREYINPSFANVLGLLKIASGIFDDKQSNATKQKNGIISFFNGNWGWIHNENRWKSKCSK